MIESVALPRPPALVAAVRTATAWLDRLPYWLLALVLRLAVASVFWHSAMAKLDNWETTLSLFADEYQVPLLPPVTAAYLATALELTCPVLLALGLGTRFAALALLGMTLVIQTFVYPDAWPTHIQWVAMILVLVGRGGGLLSADALISRICRDRLASKP